MESGGFSAEHRELAGLDEAAELILHGVLNAESVPAFKDQMQALVDRGVKRFLLGAEDLKYVNSTGLAYLINLSESLRERRGAVALVGVQSKVRIVLDTMGIASYFKLHATRDAAVQDLKSILPAPAAPPITTRRDGSSTKTGRVSPPTDVPRRTTPNRFVRFFRRLIGRR